MQQVQKSHLTVVKSSRGNCRKVDKTGGKLQHFIINNMHKTKDG